MGASELGARFKNNVKLDSSPLNDPHHCQTMTDIIFLDPKFGSVKVLFVFVSFDQRLFGMRAR